MLGYKRENEGKSYTELLQNLNDRLSKLNFDKKCENSLVLKDQKVKTKKGQKRPNKEAIKRPKKISVSLKIKKKVISKQRLKKDPQTLKDFYYSNIRRFDRMMKTRRIRNVSSCESIKAAGKDLEKKDKSRIQVEDFYNSIKQINI